MHSESELKKYHEYLLTRSNLGHWYRKNILYPKLAPQLPGKALDVGCGIGDFCLFRPNTTGIDINPFNIEYCKKLGVKEAYVIKDGFPLQNQTFDSALLDNVLEHLEQPEVVLNDVKRVLKPGGVLVVGVPGVKGFASDSDHKIFYDEPKLVKTMQENGFDFLRSFRTPLDLPFLSQFMRQYCLYGVFVKS